VSENLRQCWARSKAYRIFLILAILYAVLRMAVQGAYLAMMLYPNSGIMGGMPGWTGAEGEPMVPNDLQDYLDASSRLRKHQDLYLKGSLDRVEFYQYAPAYALAFTPFLWLSPTAVTVVHTLLHVAAYMLLYIWWGKIFDQLKLKRAQEMLALSLPVWLIFSAFWSDLGYLNIYIVVALLSTFLIESVFNERLAWSLLWLSMILQTKPHWAFAAAIPLLLGRYRFFLKLIGFAVFIYLAAVGMTMLIAGPAYIWRQYGDYFPFLLNMSANFPWRGPEEAFLGYNHSIMQIVVYLLGVTPGAMRLATVVKLVLLAPLAAIGLRYLRHPVDRPGRQVPQLALDWAFALYLGAFIWLDMVWEVSLGVAIFTYLLATLERRNMRILVWVVFLPYALVDFWQLVSFAAFGMEVIAPGPYILTDPSVYVPLVMIVILMFYTLLVGRLWSSRKYHMISLSNAARPPAG
jgi:hypothetical protein